MQAKNFAISLHEESNGDFVQIGKRVNRLDGSIMVSVYNASFDPGELPRPANNKLLSCCFLFGRLALRLIQRLCADLANMIDPH